MEGEILIQRDLTQVVNFKNREYEGHLGKVNIINKSIMVGRKEEVASAIQ